MEYERKQLVHRRIKKTHFPTFRKSSDIVGPSPSEAFVFLDEHPDGIDDGYFLVFVNRHQLWKHAANYHNGACGFSFADGHAGDPQVGGPDTKSRRSWQVPRDRTMCLGSRCVPPPRSTPVPRGRLEDGPFRGAYGEEFPRAPV